MHDLDDISGGGAQPVDHREDQGVSDPVVVDRGYRGLGDQVIAGGVEHVAERLASFRSVGVVDIVARTIAVDQPTAVESIGLLGDVRRLLA